MTEAISELSHLAATGRDARLFECLWRAHAALCFAQRGSISHTVRFLYQAQREAERHQGTWNDPRPLRALGRLRRECAVALRVKSRHRPERARS